MVTREDILGLPRRAQQVSEGTESSQDSLRIVLGFSEPRDPRAVAEEIRADLDLNVSAARLMEQHGLSADPESDALARFVAVVVPRAPKRMSPEAAFELGNALADATGALTGEPELG